LHNRSHRIILQFVKSLNLLSDWEIIRHSVPQGPVFGPLLFVYFYDFPCIIKKVCHTILCTDDTNILVSSNDLNELNSKLNLEIHSIFKWFQNNQLILNTLQSGDDFSRFFCYTHQCPVATFVVFLRVVL